MPVTHGLTGPGVRTLGLPFSSIRDVIAYYYAGSLTDAMLGLVEKTGADAQVNRANAAEARKAVQGKPKSE